MNRGVLVNRRRMLAGTTVLLALAACSSSSKQASVSSKAPTDKILRLSFLQDPGQPPDPDIYYSGQGLLLTVNAYEGLLTYKLNTAKPELAPLLATKWEASSDNKTFTLTLRSDVKFHDGTPFTSAAVKPSFDRRAAVNQGPAYMVTDVASVETPSPTQVVITLKTPNSAFLDYLASPYGPRMMSPDGLKANAGTDNDQTYLQTHDLGTGAYTITDAKLSQHYELTAFPDWWGPKPYFTKVDLPVISDLSTQQLKLNKGELAGILHDLNAPAVKSYLGNSAVSTYSLPMFMTEQVYVNPNTNPFLKSKENRLAFLKAIDIKSLAETVFKGRGEVATGTYPKGLLPDGQSPQDTTFDPEPLKAALANASASDKNLVFGYDTSQPDDQQLANLVAATMQQYGVTAKVQGFTTSQVFGWVSDIKGAPDVLFSAFWPDAGHPYTAAHILYAPDGGLEYLHCSDKAVTDQMQPALESGDTAAFAKIGVDAFATGCWKNEVYRSDFMVTQKWLKGVAESHNPATPFTLLISGLSVA